MNHVLLTSQTVYKSNSSSCNFFRGISALSVLWESVLTFAQAVCCCLSLATGSSLSSQPVLLSQRIALSLASSYHHILAASISLPVTPIFFKLPSHRLGKGYPLKELSTKIEELELLLNVFFAKMQSSSQSTPSDRARREVESEAFRARLQSVQALEGAYPEFEEIVHHNLEHRYNVVIELLPQKEGSNKSVDIVKRKHDGYVCIRKSFYVWGKAKPRRWLREVKALRNAAQVYTLRRTTISKGRPRGRGPSLKGVRTAIIPGELDEHTPSRLYRDGGGDSLVGSICPEVDAKYQGYVEEGDAKSKKILHQLFENKPINSFAKGKKSHGWLAPGRLLFLKIHMYPTCQVEFVVSPLSITPKAIIPPKLGRHYAANAQQEKKLVIQEL
ncbi:hypothetical protein MGYG_05121 [Nannizzia gypsea CBS 118893]|uniref:Uncharacterized protein n=1 Tax=Arthroderma gypseum (strain ATCC MYA-4604 / CBS 118893) TaxID=535722 RepID=E4UYF6_ARTGP|nr:hypothetical protein MGYG_05121 [Nannizzia gypsea CBS 118893]EFR02119.1 hypothetical protein MGYG_05121 [Nannizzia gypsea CBS 118893]